MEIVCNNVITCRYVNNNQELIIVKNNHAGLTVSIDKTFIYKH